MPSFVMRVLHAMGLLRPRETWLNAHLVACAFPRSETALASLASQGVTILVNLHERSHVPERLARYGICEVHFPTCDFTPPAKRDLDEGIAAIEQAVAEGRRVAVHCGGGLGRTAPYWPVILSIVGSIPIPLSLKSARLGQERWKQRPKPRLCARFSQTVYPSGPDSDA